MASPAATHSPTLHDGQSADVPEVMAVMEAAFGDRYGESWTRSQLSGILPMGGVSLIIARTGNGQCAGFSLARSVADEAELLLIAVVPEQRRRGIGRMLLDRFIGDAREQGLARIHLEVRDGNPAAAIYAAFGFEPVGRRRKYYRGSDGRRHDAISFARNL